MFRFSKDIGENMFRVEDKYILPANDFFELQKRLSPVMHPDAFSKNGQGYDISSVYFDDPEDSAWQDGIDGVPIRTKYRIRVYNGDFSVIKLEVKHKRYNRIAKLSETISQEEMISYLHGETGAWNVGDARDEFNLAVSRKGILPKVIVSYHRKAFACMAGNVRITFDEQLAASSRIDLFEKGIITKERPAPTNYILEIKYDQFLPDYIRQLLESEHLLKESFSKYGLCRECCQ